MTLRTLECFAGIGGFALAWERLGFEHVQFVEWDPYCQAVLREHWPEVPIHGDIRSFDATAFRGRVDLVSGGPPCQPASVAGKRKGSEDDRWMWPDFLRVVGEVAPQWVVAENPTGLVSLQPHGLDWILEQLEAQGYECCPVVLGADSVGAPHRRKRVWIVGRKRLADGDSERERDADKLRRVKRQGGPREADAGGCGGQLVNSRHDDGQGRDGTPPGSGHDDPARGESAPPDRPRSLVADGEGSGRTPEGDGRICGPWARCDGAEGANGNHADGCDATAGMGHPDQPRTDTQPKGCEPRQAVGESGGQLVHTAESGLEGHGPNARESEGREPGRTSASGDELGDSAGDHERGCRAGPGGQPGEAGGPGPRWPARPGERQHGWEPPRVVGNTASLRGGRRDDNRESRADGANSVPEPGDTDGDTRWGAGGDAPQFGLGRDADGLPDRLVSRIRRERLKALGNSVVPEIPYQIGLAILAAERAEGRP